MINNFFTEEDEYHCQDSIYTHPVSGHCLYLGDMSSAV